MNINSSFPRETLLTMESLALSPASVYPAFLFGTLTYVFIMFCNLLIFTTIVLNKRLHKPMFILLLNLPVSDMIGATTFFPQFVTSIILQNRSISYTACFIQALLIHIYGTASLLSLTAMAYDRYVAICCPLRYNSIMTQNTLVIIFIFIWIVDLTLMLTLLGLLSRFTICRTNIVDVYCNNPSLLKLVCEDRSVNNYYGLFTIVLIQGGSLLVIMYTYIQILLTCLITKQADARGKAIQTCATHLVVYLFLEINAAVNLISHRFENVSPYLRRAMGVAIVVTTPIVNPLIYGLKTKELRQNIMSFFRRNVCSAQPRT